MADTMKVTRELKLDMYFADNDTRMFTLDDPKTNLTKADIKAHEAMQIETQTLLGDKGGAAFVRYNSAKIYEKAVTKLDLDN